MLIDTVSKLSDVMPDLLTCISPTVDTETTGLNPWGNGTHPGDRVIGISIYTGNEAYYFPYRHYTGENLPYETMEFFRRYLSNKNRVYRGFNYKFDIHMLKADGVEYPDTIEDGLLAMHLANENETDFTLKGLCDKCGIGDGSLQESVLQQKVLDACKLHGVPVSIAKHSDINWKSKMYLLPPSDVEPYACDDVILTDALINRCMEPLEAYGLVDLWRQVNYYSLITADMENRGMLINPGTINKYSSDSKREQELSMARLSKEAGMNINPNSSKQVCRILGTPSSDDETLQAIISFGGEQSAFAAAVSEARGWSSVCSRYYTPYLQKMDSEGALHASLNLIGTISGRLSCSNPNLQAVARKTDVFKVKDVFVPRDGYTMVSADYRQAEMRLASFYAKENTMAENIRAGLDIHTHTATILGIPRDAAKRINFGVIYGIGAKSLSEGLHIPEKTAREYLKSYHDMYPGFRKLSRCCESMAERDGFIRMWTGRVRRYDANNPTHKAMSNLIQGGVAEIMRVSISRLHPVVSDLGGYMTMQVHDQILFEVPDNMVSIAVPVIREIMEDFSFDPRMEVDIKAGKSWGEMQAC